MKTFADSSGELEPSKKDNLARALVLATSLFVVLFLSGLAKLQPGLFLIVYASVMILVALLSSEKGRNPIVWFGLTLVFSAIAAVLILIATDLAEQKRHEEENAELKEKNAELAQDLARRKKQDLLDQHSHDTPVIYQVGAIGSHPSQTLALRYGIIIDSEYVRLRKIKKVEHNLFLAELYDFSKNRNKVLKVIVAHHVGKREDFIRSFLPIDPDTETVDNNWFTRNKKLENVLKDNKHMTLSKIAHYYMLLADVK